MSVSETAEITVNHTVNVYSELQGLFKRKVFSFYGEYHKVHKKFTGLQVNPRKSMYRKLASRNTSRLVTPHVTN